MSIQRKLYIGGLAGLAGLGLVIFVGACDTLDEEFTDDVTQRSLDRSGGPLPLDPGGGTCEECILGGVMRSPSGQPEKTLELSFDLRDTYIMPPNATGDDVPLAALLLAATVAGSEVTWELVTASGEVVCRAQPLGGTCRVGAVEPGLSPNIATIVVEYTSELHEVPTQLRLTQGLSLTIVPGPLQPALSIEPTEP